MLIFTAGEGNAERLSAYYLRGYGMSPCPQKANPTATFARRGETQTGNFGIGGVAVSLFFSENA